jgi:hypothetical protein
VAVIGKCFYSKFILHLQHRALLDDSGNFCEAKEKSRITYSKHDGNNL